MARRSFHCELQCNASAPPLIVNYAMGPAAQYVRRSNSRSVAIRSAISTASPSDCALPCAGARIPMIEKRAKAITVFGQIDGVD